MIRSIAIYLTMFINFAVIALMATGQISFWQGFLTWVCFTFLMFFHTTWEASFDIKQTPYKSSGSFRREK